jgi:uncharacterized protein (DUF1501 family)
MMTQFSRRSLLLAGCAATLISAAPGARAYARATDAKLIVIILRGAMDGLAALPKTDDPDIRALRQMLVDPNALALDEGFALHSAMPKLAEMYRAKEAAFVPAIAGPYRERSHFEAQDLLETGTASGVGAEGWLNRALQRAPGSYSAVSIGPSQPLILRGASQKSVSWSPPVLPEASEDTLSRILKLYDNDPVLKPALTAAIGADMIAGDASGGVGGGRAGPGQYAPMLEAAARFLVQPDGPEIAVVGFEGWDTHIDQNNALNQRFAALDNAIAAARDVLGPAWKRTVIVAVSEFGRTVRINGGRGTDHGTGGLGILAGGAIKGGRMLGDWPGLASSALYENRDLMPTVEVRSIFKGVLHDHLGWAANDLEATVFPDSSAAKAMTGLV